MSQHKQRYIQARNITVIGALTNVLQGVLKLIGGFWFHSHALIADAVHSFSDLLSDFMVLFASHYGNQDADDAHPYGHRRIETVGTLLVSILLIFVGGSICWDALTEFTKIWPEVPTQGALCIAGFSILLNEILFFVTLHVAKKIHSNLIKANAWHHRSDSATSLVVALGILGSLLGYHHLDAIAAVVVSLLIIKMGIEYSWHSIKELIDTAVKPELIEDIQQTIASIPGVNKIHQLRTRSMGDHILVDVHILVFPYLSVSEGHYIAQHVHELLMKQYANISDVTVHVDPEDDESVSPSKQLPNRKHIEKEWLIPLQEQFPDIQTWIIHYLNGQLTIDLYLKNTHNRLDSLRKRCDQLIKMNAVIKLFRYFHPL
ncbi:MAG: cation diffusion facilitator family transporter [Gammaproteobacteria bacterium]|nr:cation diffusion facilitator family transporter [Gammaproteobacteria bacterium]